MAPRGGLGRGWNKVDLIAEEIFSYIRVWSKGDAKGVVNCLRVSSLINLNLILEEVDGIVLDINLDL